ncbi:MAG TPA: hypothetical protein VF437_06755 [Verrucomicrobiae bacterium]
MKKFICQTCGKEWPENYCPECQRTIDQQPTANSSPMPPPLPKLPQVISEGISTSKSTQKQRPLRSKIVFGIIVALVIGVSGGYFGYQFYQLHSFPPGYRNRPAYGWSERPGEKEFSEADKQIDSFKGTTAFGNSPEAIKLATQFSEALKVAREELFTHGLGIDLFDSTKGEFLTCCELHDRECAFIVHVPGLRHFEKNFTQKVDARKLLAQAAWLSAQKILKANQVGKPQMELAVGLRGISQYSPMMLGYYRENLTDPDDGVVKYLDDYELSNFLWAFFAPVSDVEKTNP